MQLCALTPLPTFNALYYEFLPNLTFPPKNFKLPSLPTIPYPMFPSLTMPNFSMVKLISALQGIQVMNICFAMVKPLVDFLGLSIDAILPKIPVLNVNLVEILTGDAEKLVAKVVQAIKDKVQLPYLPLPFNVSFASIEIQAIQMLSNIVSAYMMTIPAIISDLINQVVSMLHIPGLPAIPTIPTMDDIIKLIIPVANKLIGPILSKIEGIKNQVDGAIASGMSKVAAIQKYASNLDQTAKALLNTGLTKIESLEHLLMAKFDISLLFNFVIPGFPPLPKLPSPLIPTFSMPEIEFQEAMNILMNHLTTAGLTLIMDFINSVLAPFISFTFPKICIDFPEIPRIEIPKIAIPTIVIPKYQI